MMKMPLEDAIKVLGEIALGDQERDAYDTLVFACERYRALYESAEKRMSRYRDLAGKPDIPENVMADKEPKKNASKRLHALIDRSVPMASAYPMPISNITSLHIFKSDIGSDSGWYRFDSDEDKRRYDALFGKIRKLKQDLIEKEMDDVLTNADVDMLEMLIREMDSVRLIKCGALNKDA